MKIEIDEDEMTTNPADVLPPDSWSGDGGLLDSDFDPATEAMVRQLMDAMAPVFLKHRMVMVSTPFYGARETKEELG